MEVEYVYALHDFEPQNDDEIAFVAGERIEVLEKDDAYGDGWWTGRNLAGQEGIFPKDYTTPADPLIPELGTPAGQTTFTPSPKSGGYNNAGSGFHAGGYGSTLHPLTEEPEPDSSSPIFRQNGISKSGLNAGLGVGDGMGKGGGGGGQVMAATMTDIQHAIDQLGVRRQMVDDGRSISFISTRDDDHDQRSVKDSMFEGEEGMDATTPGGHGRMTMNEDLHRDARRRLFEKIDQMDAQRRAQEEEEQHHRPPVDVEFSDESEDEDGHHPHPHHHHQYSPPNDLLHRIQRDDSIPSTLPGGHSTTSLPFTKEDSMGDADVSTNTAGTKPDLTESPSKADGPTLAQHLEAEATSASTDTRALTPVQRPKQIVQEAKPVESTAAPVEPEKDVNQDQYLPTPVTSPFVVSSFSAAPPSAAVNQVTSSTIYPSKPPPVEEPGKEVKSAAPAVSSSYVSFLPSPTTATFNTGGTTVSTSPNSGGISQGSNQSQVQINQTQFNVSQASSSTEVGKDASASTSNLPTTVQGLDSSLISNGHASMISNTTASSLAPPPAPTQTSPPGKKRIPPSEWTVDQVVEWIRSKGFDEPTCAKFAEHEISGDVLLEFDANMLKEIDIIAFGKRMKIASAISELRRPPSFESSDAVSLNPQSISQFSMIGGQSTLSSVPHSAPHFSSGIAFPQSTPQASPSMLASSISMPQMAYMHPTSNISHSMSQGGYTASISSPSHSPNIFGVLQSQQQQQLPPLGQFTTQLPGQVQGVNEGYSPGPFVMISPGGGMYTGDRPGSANQQRSGMTHTHTRVDSDPGVSTVDEAGRIATTIVGFDKAATVGYSGMKEKNLSLSLALSPSEANLAQRDTAPIILEEDVERAALSDSDLRKRHRGVNSVDSGTTHDPPDTPGSRSDTPSKSSARNRASLDTKSERMSFFGAMGRSRKPAPRYSTERSGSEMGSPNITQAEKQKTYSKLYLAGPTRPPRVGKTKEEKEKEKKEKLDREIAKRKGKDQATDLAGSGVLKKRNSGDERRTGGASPASEVGKTSGAVTLRTGEDVLKQLKEIVGDADHSGFMFKKGERYNTWKNRFFFLKGPHLYYLRSMNETRIKGYINIRGYKVIADEATNPGRYGFRIIHDVQKPHSFSSEDQSTIREWMKSLMKATIDRDYAQPVISSCNIPTIPLSIAQSMNPAPRPPSPTAIAAVQRASRQGDSNGLSSRDAKVLMGIAEGSAILGNVPQSPVPARPSREMRRPSVINKSDEAKGGSNAALIQWINSLLPDQTPYATDLSTSLSSGLILFRLAESIKYGQDLANARIRNPSPDDPLVPDKLFEGGEDRIDGLMKLFDFLLDNDVKLSGISMADIKEGRSEKIITLLRSMKQWKEQQDAIAKGQAGAFWIHR